MKARGAIVDILYRVFEEDAYASLLMRHRLENYSSEDRRLISEVVYGTLRNRDYLDYQLAEFIEKKCKPKTKVILEMSAYQFLFLDSIPEYAIVNEAVNIADKKDAGFVNAVLHKLITRGKIEVDAKDPLEKCAIETSHPLWLLKLWKSHYGLENTLEMAYFNQTPANVYGRYNPLKITKEKLSKDEKVHWVSEDVFLYDGLLQETSYFQNGEVLIQDRASSQVVSYLEVRPNLKVMDCCSAPGTKTQQIATLMNNEGMIIASDIYPERVELIKQLMEKTGVSIVKTRVRDACIEDEHLEKEAFDRILLDVPCSGLGDLRHKPEIRYHITPENLDTLVQIQKRILNVNADYLKKGGILVYSTCTLNKKENETQIAQFLNAHEDFELLKEKTYFPKELNSDGFYVAELRKI